MALTLIKTAAIEDDAVTAGKIPANAVGSSEIADDAVTQAQVAGASIDEAKMNISNAGTNGQYLQKQSGNTGGLTWADVPAGVGGATGVDFNDDVKIRLGTGNDFEIYHDGSNSFIKGSGTGNLAIQSNGTSSVILQPVAGENSVVGNSNGSVDLYYDNSKKFATHNTGVKVTGIATISSDLNVAGITTVGILTAYESITVKVGAGSTELTTALSAKASTGKAIAMAMVFG